MHRLIEDYEKALTEEFEQWDRLRQIEEKMALIEAEQWTFIIDDDPKLPQWKAQHIMTLTMETDGGYKTMLPQYNAALRCHRKAKIRLAVITERLKLTKARLYGGRNEMLDLQKVEQVDYETLA